MAYRFCSQWRIRAEIPLTWWCIASYMYFNTVVDINRDLTPVMYTDSIITYLYESQALIP